MDRATMGVGLDGMRGDRPSQASSWSGVSGARTASSARSRGAGGASMECDATEPSCRRSDGAGGVVPRRAASVERRTVADLRAVISLQRLPIERGRATTAVLVQPGRTLTTPARHNLPHPLTSFVGRGQELAEVARLLRTTRLLTLTGAGGIGKTRFGQQIAGSQIEAYPDGVWLIELAALADPELVSRAVANALGIRDRAERPRLDTLTEALQSRRLLLVLDNCEHVLAICATLAERL